MNAARHRVARQMRETAPASASRWLSVQSRKTPVDPMSVFRPSFNAQPCSDGRQGAYPGRQSLFRGGSRTGVFSENRAPAARPHWLRHQAGQEASYFLGNHGPVCSVVAASSSFLAGRGRASQPGAVNSAQSEPVALGPRRGVLIYPSSESADQTRPQCWWVPQPPGILGMRIPAGARAGWRIVVDRPWRGASWPYGLSAFSNGIEETGERNLL